MAEHRMQLGLPAREDIFVAKALSQVSKVKALAYMTNLTISDDDDDDGYDDYFRRPA